MEKKLYRVAWVILTLSVWMLAQEQKIKETETYRIGLEKSTGIEQPFILDVPIDPSKYIVGPGDEFYLSMVTDRIIEFKLRVCPTGELLIPSIGKIYVSGLRLEEAINKIVGYIKKKGVRAEVNISLSDIRKFKSQILGAVKKPGFYIIDSATRLQELVELAGGFRPLAKQHQILIFKDGVVVDTVNFVRYVVYGSIEDNPTLLEGEVVYVPFGDIKKDAVYLTGAVDDSGYCVIEPGETLGQLLKRRGYLKKGAILDQVFILRKRTKGKDLIRVSSQKFDEMVLKPGDEINVLPLEGVIVIGHVKKPGEYSYFPSLSVYDYIGIAGGISEKGSLKKVVVIHKDGSREIGQRVVIKRGDIIIVNRNSRDILIGERSSILEVLSSVMSILLAYIAATRYYR